MKLSKTYYIVDPGWPTKKSVGKMVTCDGVNANETQPLIIIGITSDKIYEPPFAVIKNLVSYYPTIG